MTSDQDKFYKKPPFHRRNDVVVGEHHDVFDLSSSSLMRRGWISGGPRMSLDMPNMRNSNILLGENKQSLMGTTSVNNNNNNKEKKHKQPSSPGGRLASFLNSLFSQSSSSKKKKSAATQQSIKDDDESPGGAGRRKRRSSISHFRGSAATPIKHMSLPSKIVKPCSSSSVKSEVVDYSWLDDHKFQWDRKQRVYANGYLEKDHKKNIINQRQEEDEKGFKRFHDHDGGGESDSSSDLFELKNYDLGYDDSCGLPVYETTHMNNIKRPAMVGSST